MRLRRMASCVLVLASFAITAGAQDQVPATGQAATSAPAAATPLTQADRDKALKYLEETRQGVVDATKGLSEAQWNFKPAPDRWSVAECMEHIALAEDFMRGLVVDKVMKAPARRELVDLAQVDEMVITMIPDRSHKRQAPDPLKPVNHFGSPDASLKHFMDSRTTTEGYLTKTAGLRDHAIMSPLGKDLDGYEWILFIGAHSKRHTEQILEVKADPKFPKS